MYTISCNILYSLFPCVFLIIFIPFHLLFIKISSKGINTLFKGKSLEYWDIVKINMKENSKWQN